MPHKLLLADDSITIQRVIELTFADEDVQVFAVGDGKKAIASIESDRPDIVLADVGMPERDGYEVAEFIKGNPELAGIPVLLLTGAFEPIDESRARAVGCDGVLVKPFEPQMVINRVKDLLAGRRPGGLWGKRTTASPPSREAAPAPPATDTNAQPAATTNSGSASSSLEDYFDRLDAAFASVEAATGAQGLAPGAARSSSAVSSADIAPGSSSGLATDDLEGWDPDLTGDPVRTASATPSPVAPSPAPTTAPTPPTPALARAGAVPESTPVIRFKPVAPAPAGDPPPAPIDSPARTATPSPAVSVPLAAPVPPPAPFEPPAAIAEVAPTPIAERRESAPPSPPASPIPVATATPAAPLTAIPTSLPSLAEAFVTLLSAEQGRSISPSKTGASNVSDQTIDDIVNRVIARMTDQAVRETVIEVAERLVRDEIQRIKQGQ